jgi:aryl-alcohol dehydrogenase-like predicted oxidoreductase
MSASKLILGTANFINPYGLYQKDFKIIQSELDKIISLSLKNNVTTIDTAIHYGKPYDILQLQKKFQKFKIINKIKPNEKELQELDLKFTDTLLLHIDPRQKYDTNYLIKLLLITKKRKPNINVGVSIYDESDIESDVYDVCDLVQLPVSVLDKTLLETGFVERLKSMNIQIHSRSIFLQGILLNDPKTLKKNIGSLVPSITKFQAFCREKNYSPLQVCLNFVLTNNLIDFSICGFNSYAELKQLIQIEKQRPLDLSDMPYFDVQDSEMLKPYNW